MLFRASCCDSGYQTSGCLWPKRFLATASHLVHGSRSGMMQSASVCPHTSTHTHMCVCVFVVAWVFSCMCASFSHAWPLQIGVSVIGACAWLCGYLCTRTQDSVTFCTKIQTLSHVLPANIEVSVMYVCAHVHAHAYAAHTCFSRVGRILIPSTSYGSSSAGLVLLILSRLSEAPQG